MQALEVGRPGRLAAGLECEVDGGGADGRGQVLEHLVVLVRVRVRVRVRLPLPHPYHYH